MNRRLRHAQGACLLLPIANFRSSFYVRRAWRINKLLLHFYCASKTRDLEET